MDPAQPARPRVLVTDNIHPSAVDILQDAAEVVFEKSLSHEALLGCIGSFDGLMIRSASTVSADVLAAAPRLKIVGRAGVGTDNIDLPQATQQGVIVVNSPEGNTIAASEHTVGLLMALARHIPQADASMKGGEWKRSQLTGVELAGKTLGVIGLGKIGARVAKVCRALGMRVLVHDPFLAAQRADELGVKAVELSDIWREADFITIHAPKTRDTVNLLNATTLAQCKAGVRIINCARGGIIHEGDLADAIRSGHVAAAAIDVFSAEPAPADCPLLGLGDRVVLTPHLGASTEEAQVNVALDVARQLRDFFREGFAQNAVNIPMLRKEALDPVKHLMPMAETLGALVRQIARGAAQSVEISLKGAALAPLDSAPLMLAALKGLLAQSREGVNYVNAMVVAEESGIALKHSSAKTLDSYQNLLEVTLTTDRRAYRVAATHLHGDSCRIVDVDGYVLSLDPTEHVLFTPHEDRPGMVGATASLLGAQHINISAMQVARRQGTRAAGGESLMIFSLDGPVEEPTLQALRALPGINAAVYAHLPVSGSAQV